MCLMTAIATGLKTGSLTLSLSYHMHNTALSCVKHPESTHSTDYGRVDSSIVLDIDILDFQIIGACHKQVPGIRCTQVKSLSVLQILPQRVRKIGYFVVWKGLLNTLYQKIQVLQGQYSHTFTNPRLSVYNDDKSCILTGNIEPGKLDVLKPAKCRSFSLCTSEDNFHKNLVINVMMSYMKFGLA